jgi:hypothetical protein
MTVPQRRLVTLLACVIGIAAFVPAASAHDVTSGVTLDALDRFAFSDTALEHTASAIRTKGAGLAANAADDPSGDRHSENFRKLARTEITKPDGSPAAGSDLAFRGRLMVAGTYDGTAFFRIGANSLRQISFHDCPGSQGDVSILGNYVFVSIDSPSSNDLESPTCNNTSATGLHDSDSSLGKEGIRIVDISDVANPRQVGFVETECGSHTHTLIPGAQTSYIYVDSYPLTDASPDCSELTHPEGEFSVLEFPTADPTQARIASTPDVLPPSVSPETIGCHDTGVLPEQDLAAAACLGAFAILDISDPTDPKTLSVVQNPLIELDHSAQLTWDGKYAVIGDEHAGAAGGGGCSPNQNSPVGAMWFYDISDRTNPRLEGSYSLPRVPPVDNPEEVERFRCTTHNYEVLPMRDPSRYVAVSPYYAGGLSVVDFSDPAQPKELGHYLPQVEGENPDMWSGYWYDGRIYTNEHSSELGVSAFEMSGLSNRRVRPYSGTLNPQTQLP